MDRFIVMYDLETVGCLESPENDRIAQIAAVATQVMFDDATQSIALKPIEQYERKVTIDPAEFRPGIAELIHYNSQVWAETAVGWDIMVSEFDNFIQKYRSVSRTSKAGKPYQTVATGGFNVVRFDDPRVRAYYKGLNKFCPMDYMAILDVAQMAYQSFTLGGVFSDLQNLKLPLLMEHLGISPSEAHDALDDCYSSITVANYLLANRNVVLGFK